MARFAHAVAAAALGAWLGVQLFLAYVVAPGAFALDRGLAVRLMERVFPAYYAFGVATTGLVLVLVALSARAPATPLRRGTAILLAIALGGTVYAGYVLLPQTGAARLRAQAALAGDAAPLAFSRLHRRAVAVNIALFAVSALALGLHALSDPRPPRPPPGTGAARAPYS